MPPQFDADALGRINLVVSAACHELGLAVEISEAGPTDTLLEALGFKAGESTLQLLAAVDIDSVSPRDITTLAELSGDEQCLRRLEGVRITRDLLDLLAFPAIRTRMTQHLIEEVAESKWTNEPGADVYGLGLATAGAVDANLVKVGVIDSLEDLQTLARHAEQALATTENRFPPPPFQVPPDWELLEDGHKLTAALKEAEPHDDFNELPWSQSDLGAGRMFYMRSPTGELWTVTRRSF